MTATTRHSRNVDKQRRRLLAEVCERRAGALQMVPEELVTKTCIRQGIDYWQAVDLVVAKQGARAAKLRALAERLRAAPPPAPPPKTDSDTRGQSAEDRE